jgi:hypothetical protein
MSATIRKVNSTSDNSYYDYSKKNMLIISPLIQYGDNSIYIANYSLSRIPPSVIWSTNKNWRTNHIFTLDLFKETMYHSVCVWYTPFCSEKLRHGFAPNFVNYKKRCIRPAVACDKVYQLFAHGRWFSPGTPASSTTKTGYMEIKNYCLNVLSIMKVIMRRLIHML